MAVLLRAIMNRGGHRVATLVGSALSAWGLLAGCSSILGIESFSPATDGGTGALVDAAHDARIGDGGQQAGDTGSVSPLACLGLSNGSACASCAGSSCAGQLSSLTPGCDAYLQCVCGGSSYDAGAVAQCQGDVTGPCASALENVGDCLVTYCPECSSEDAGPDGAPFVAEPCHAATLGDGGSCVSFDEASSSSVCSTMFPTLIQDGFEAQGPPCDDAGGATSWAFICCPPACSGGGGNDCPSPLAGEQAAAEQCQATQQTISGWLYEGCDGGFNSSMSYACCPP